MFIKKTKAKSYEYIKLVESYWENGKSRHRVLYNFGRADLIKKDESFLSIVKKLCEIVDLPLNGDNSIGKNALPDDCSEAVLYNYGYLAYEKIWRELGIDGTLEALQFSSSKTEFPIPETVFLMAIQHLLEPRSKLSTYLHQNRYFNLTEIPLQHMYRALDKLSDWKEEIEAELFEYNYVRVNKKVDVVFYDVTTFEFESVVPDELRDFGYSKACKFGEVQVVMGMIIDEYGMPVGFELFKGNTFDGKTMVKALENIKKRFGIHRVIIVADRGLNSKGNLNLIKEAGYGYIMSSRIRCMSKVIKEKILDTTGFTVVSDDSGNENFRYKTIDYVNVFTDEDGVKHMLPESLVISYSPKRAIKDRKDRERLVEKAKKLLESPEKITASSKRGYRKYLSQAIPETTESPKGESEKSDPEKVEPEITWELALEKITQDAIFDGYYGIQSSEKNMTATEVMEAYHMLWKIEESFRIMKTTMEVRPIFHWTPKRITGHFVACFLAFIMERKMELLLKDEKDEVLSSPHRIQEALNTMQLAAVTANNQEMFIRAKSDPLSKKIFKLLKIKMPSSISTKCEITARLTLDAEPQEVQLTFL